MGQLKFNDERYGQWIRCSIGWMGEDNEGFLMQRIQGLGWIDAQLFDVNKIVVNGSVEDEISTYSIVDVQSYLWVLGVYELFRMFDQRLRNNIGSFDDATKETVRNAKFLFSRIRVPLAKLEASNRHAQDYAIPKIGGTDFGFGWKLNDKDIVMYQELSDLALDTLKKIRSYKINQNVHSDS